VSVAKIMGLKEVVNHFQKYLSNPSIAKKLGVTPDQVYKYGNGVTRSPRDAVIDAIYDNLTIKGERIVIDFYESEKHYLEMRSLR